MALKEDYKDAVFAGLRKYKMLDNGDGTVSLVDMTECEAAGDKFGAKDVNAITKTVNATGEIIADDNDGFKPDQKYVIGDIVIYDNKTWRFKVDHEPGEWDESQVERTNILAVIAEQNKNSLRQIWKKLETSKHSISIPTDLDYSELAIYISTSGVIVGEIHVVKEYLSNVGKIFRCGNGFITGITENILIQANVSLSTITGSIYVKDSVVSSETTIFYR